MKSLTIKSLFVFNLLILSFAFTYAQQKVIQGKVVAFDSIGLKNVKVMAVKSKESVLTDSQGNYQISCKSKDVLKIVAFQFKPIKEKVKAESPNTLNFNLEYNIYTFDLAKALQDDYVNRSDSFAVHQYLDNHPPNFCNFTDIYQIVETCCNNAEVVKPDLTGLPNASFDKNVSMDIPIIRISGFKRTVLYVVDGLTVNNIDNLFPCEIVSVKLITNPTETSKYIRGSEKSGVLEIKTNHK